MSSRGIGHLRRWARTRPVAAAAALYTLLAVVFLAPGLLPDHTISGSDYLWTSAPWNTSRPADVRPFGANRELVDPVTVFQPFLQYTRDQQPGVPLWNPHIQAGRPFLADQQSAVFSPFSVPSYVLPFWWSLSFVGVLKLVVAALGTFLLGRALGMRFAGAFLAGLVYAFGLFFVVWLPWPLPAVWALIPWLLWLTDRLVRRPDLASGAALAAVVGLQYLGGHPESSFHAMIATVAFFALRAWQARREGVVRPMVVFGAALVAGAAVAALTILPFLELLGRSGEVSRRAGVEPAFVPRKYLLAILLPDWWGRPTQSALQGYEVVRAFYAGVLTLALAAAAVLLRPRLERVAVAVFGLLVLAVVLGIPPVFEVVTALPGFSTTYNTRLTILFLLCVALLAGWGLDELSRRVPRERRMTVLLAALGLGLVAVPVVALAAEGRISLRFLGDALGVASGFAHPPGLASPDVEPVVRLAALVVWVLVAGAALALLALRRAGRLAAGTFATLAVAIVAVDLFRAGMGQNPGLTLAQARQPVTGAIRYLQARRPARFVGLVARNAALALPPDLAMRYGLYDARSYDYPVERRYDRLWRREVAPPRSYQPSTTLAQSTPARPADAVAARRDRPARPARGAAAARPAGRLRRAGRDRLCQRRGPAPRVAGRSSAGRPRRARRADRDHRPGVRTASDRSHRASVVRAPRWRPPAGGRCEARPLRCRARDHRRSCRAPGGARPLRRVLSGVGGDG